MDNTILMNEMIEICRDVIEDNPNATGLPASVSPSHLLWMCDRLTEHLDKWSGEKLNRWIGFIQGALIANRMIDLQGAKGMFTKAKIAFGEKSQDLLDHLDPINVFRLELGGQG